MLGRQRLSQRREAQSEVWLGRAEFEDLIRPQVAEAVEALRCAGVGPGDLDGRAPVGRSSRVPLVAQPVSAELGRPVAVDPRDAIALGPALSGLPADIVHPADIRPSLTTVPLYLEPADVQWRRARSQRFAVAGVLALVVGAASVPLITSHSGSIHSAAAENPAPAVAIPAPGTSNDNSPRSTDSTGAVHTAPPPSTPADGPAPQGAAAVPTPHTTRSDNRTASRSKPPAAMVTRPPQRTSAGSAEAYMRSQAAAFSANDQHRTRRHREPPQHP